MYAGQQAANQNELNSNLLKSQLAAAVHSRSQSLSGLQPVSYNFLKKKILSQRDFLYGII